VFVHYYLPLGVSSEKLSFGVEVSSALVVLLLLGVSDFFREVFLFRELCISFITFKKKCISFISALALVIMSHYLYLIIKEEPFPWVSSVRGFVRTVSVVRLTSFIVFQRGAANQSS
jgi:hypothetical protein